MLKTTLIRKIRRLDVASYCRNSFF